MISPSEEFCNPNCIECFTEKFKMSMDILMGKKYPLTKQLTIHGVLRRILND